MFLLASQHAVQQIETAEPALLIVSKSSPQQSSKRLAGQVFPIAASKAASFGESADQLAERSIFTPSPQVGPAKEASAAG